MTYRLRVQDGNVGFLTNLDFSQYPEFVKELEDIDKAKYLRIDTSGPFANLICEKGAEQEVKEKMDQIIRKHFEQ